MVCSREAAVRRPAGPVRRMAASASWLAAASMSASVVQRPTDSRIAARARFSSKPIAVSTGEGSCWPLWHADPVEAPTPGAAASSYLGPAGDTGP